MQNLTDKIPPHNIQAEQIVLGAALCHQDCAFHALSILREEDFYQPAHQAIFRALRAIHKQNGNINIVSTVDKLRAAKKLDAVGGPAYLSSLTDLIPSVADTKTYAQLIKHKADLRRTIHTAANIIDRCYVDNGMPAASMIEDLEKIVFDASTQRKTNDFEHISTIIDRTVDGLKKLQNGKAESLGLKTGYNDLDFLLRICKLLTWPFTVKLDGLNNSIRRETHPV